MKKRILSLILILVLLTGMHTYAEELKGSDANSEYSFTYSIYNGEVSITDCDKSVTGTVEIPNYIEGYPVTKINYYAFSFCIDVEEIKIPNTVYYIGFQAFYSCVSLKTVHMPSSLITIDYGAFSQCDALEEIYLPSSVSSIGKNAFSSCENLKTIYYAGNEEAWKKISIDADNEELLSDIQIVYNAVNESGTIHPGLTYDFDKNGTLTISGTGSELAVPDHLRNKVRILIVNDGITGIGWDAFSGCESLEEVYLPGSLHYINGNAFSDCIKLKKIKTDYKAKASHEYSGIAGISPFSFKGCTNLEIFEVPYNIKMIGHLAFSECSSLKYVVIPNRITMMQDMVFYGCSSLEKVYYTGTKSEWESMSIGKTGNEAVLENAEIVYNYVPTNGDENSTYAENSATENYGFTDVDQKLWAYDAIMRAVKNKWFNGYPDGRFLPDGTITRAEALKVLVTTFGFEIPTVVEAPYYDVSADEWYAPYVAAGRDLFPIKATIQGKIPFLPDTPVTREDTVFALVKAFGYDIGEKYTKLSILNMFNDQDTISDDMKPYFALALEKGLVSGYSDSTVRAQGHLTRAEFATLLCRAFDIAPTLRAVSIIVTPSDYALLQVGEEITLTARATHADGKNKVYEALEPYIESDNGVISLADNKITALKEGMAVVKFNNELLKNEELIIEVSNFYSAPKLKVTDFEEITTGDSATISGTVTDESGKTVDLICNDKDVEVKPDGKFSVSIKLEKGDNEITFVAKNVYGIESVRVINIKRK